MGSAPVGVQYTLHSPLVEFLRFPRLIQWSAFGIHTLIQWFVAGKFPGYWNWLWCPGLSPVLVFIAFSLRLPYHKIFPFTLLHLTLCFFFTTDVSAPIGRPFTYSLFRWVFRLGTGSGTWCCGLRGGARVRMKQISRFKFLPWPGFETRTLLSDGHKRYHSTKVHPLYNVYIVTPKCESQVWMISRKEKTQLDIEVLEMSFESFLKESHNTIVLYIALYLPISTALLTTWAFQKRSRPQ